MLCRRLTAWAQLRGLPSKQGLWIPHFLPLRSERLVVGIMQRSSHAGIHKSPAHPAVNPTVIPAESLPRTPIRGRNPENPPRTPRPLR